MNFKVYLVTCKIRNELGETFEYQRNILAKTCEKAMRYMEKQLIEKGYAEKENLFRFHVKCQMVINQDDMDLEL